MKILVTGATGYIGRSLLPQLLAQQWGVVSLQRPSKNHTSAATPQWDTHLSERGDTHLSNLSGQQWDTHSFDEQQWDTHSPGSPDEQPTNAATLPPVPAIIQGDLGDTHAVALACQGVDVVIHLAGIAHVGAGEAELRAINLDASLSLARAAKQAGVGRFIFISSSKARYPDHSAYGRLKLEAETQLLALHQPGSFEVVCLRPALVYGPGMRGNLAGLLRLLQRKRLPVFVSSDQPMGMIGREDLCRAIVLAVTSGNVCGANWELSDGETYTLNAIVARARIMLGLRPPLLHLPRPLVRWLTCAAQTLAPLHRSSLSMSTYRTLFEEDYPQDTRFAQATGFVPAENFYQSLPDLLGVPKA